MDHPQLPGHDRNQHFSLPLILCILLYCTALYCTALYCTVLITTLHSIALYSIPSCIKPHGIFAMHGILICSFILFGSYFTIT